MKCIATFSLVVLLIGSLAANAETRRISTLDSAELIEALDRLVESKEVVDAPTAKISTMAVLGFTVSDIDFSASGGVCKILVHMKKGDEALTSTFPMVAPGGEQAKEGRFGAWATKFFSDFTLEYQKVSKACVRISSAK